MRSSSWCNAIRVTLDNAFEEVANEPSVAKSIVTLVIVLSEDCLRSFTRLCGQFVTRVLYHFEENGSKLGRAVIGELYEPAKARL